MPDEIMTLAGEFPAATHEDWLGAVDKVLRGKDFQSELRSATPDGIVIEPLYTLEDEDDPPQTPSVGVSRRASNVAGLTQQWDVRQHHAVIDPGQTNAAILTDLKRGVTSIELDTTGLVDEGLLDQVLADVLLDLAPVSLVSEGDGLADAERFLTLATRRGTASSSLVAHLGCDPIGHHALTGSAHRPISEAIAAVGVFATNTARSHPAVRSVRAEGGIYAEAGATPATELAATVATGLTYVRAMVEAGLDIDAAFDQVLLSVTVGTDQFGDMAKLRALRVMWARIADVCGASTSRAVVQATTAAAGMTQRDPWVNMLRVTIGCFAAATGGADIVVVRPFDSMVGVADELGRRVARNTQLALLEESNLHRVIDPAGGSWYVEHLTDELAVAAWAIFRELETEGGIVAALESGALQDRVDRAWATTEAEVATRVRPITGVSEFPDIDEPRLARAPSSGPQQRAAMAPEIRPLPARRLAAGYERLRDAADAASPPPAVFLANLGPVATHTARASWAKNFFEAGGIRAIGNDGFDDPELLAAAFEGQPARIAVVCSSDAVYQQWATDAALALRKAGAERVYLAGHPGDQQATYQAAGIDEFIHVGCDVLASLSHAHSLLGLTTEDAK